MKSVTKINDNNMAFRKRHYHIKSKKSILFNIQEDIREWEIEGVARMRCKLIRGVNQFLSVEVSNQHAEESMFDIIDHYKDQDSWIEVERVDFPY